MKKVWFLLGSAVLFVSAVNAQEPSGLLEGDKMPDIPLGTVVNNTTGKQRFSDFKGKLVILDFWNVNCYDCKAGFPKMEKLQKQFKDQVQIFLVNPYETKEQIASSENMKDFKMPDLPSIEGAKELRSLFMVERGVPHHIWIDGNGIIRLNGKDFNTNEEKIKSCLNGNNIFYVKDNNSCKVFDKKTPYYKILSRDFDSLLMTDKKASFFTKFNNEYAAWIGGKVENLVDSASKTIRSTYVNREVTDLYRSIFTDALLSNKKRVIYSRRHIQSNDYLDFNLYYVADTSRYSTDNLIYTNWTDSHYIKSRFCYEQITSSDLSIEKRRGDMLKDLNEYFGKLYDVKVKLELLNIPCYALIRTSQKNSFKPIEGRFQETIVKNGKPVNVYFGTSFDVAIDNAIKRFDFPAKLNGFPLLILNETGITGRIGGISLPVKGVSTIEELQSALRPNGLDIKLVNRDMYFVVFEEKGLR